MAGLQAWDFLSGNGEVRTEFLLSPSPTKDQWNPLFLRLPHPQMQGETWVLCSASTPLLSANPENSQLPGILAVLQVISGSDQLIVPKSRPGWGPGLSQPKTDSVCSLSSVPRSQPILSQAPLAVLAGGQLTLRMLFIIV